MNLIEFWLEESATQTKEENDARNEVAARLAEIRKQVLNPQEVDDSLPPHMRR